MGVHSALYGAIMALHLICVIGGFGIVLAKGLGSIWVVPGDLGKARRITWEAGIGLVYLVPVFGIADVIVSNGRWQFAQIWIGMSFVLWLLAALVLTFVVRPGERRLAVLAGADGVGPMHGSPESNEVSVLLRRAAKASFAVNVAMTIAIVLMIAKPGA